MQALHRYLRTFKSLPPERVVQEIAQGRDLPTQAVVNLSGTTKQDNAYRKRLVNAGVTAVVLGFLSRCENDKFPDVLAETEYGDLAMPFVWINLLLNNIAKGNLPKALLKKVRLQIARAMGPLVRCMCNDQARELFGEKLHWHSSVPMFVALVQNLVLSPETIPILLKYERLAVFLIQSMFWETHRPDIVQESKTYGRFIMPSALAQTRRSASEALQEFVDVEKEARDDDGVCFTKEGQERLERFAHTLIVSQEYDAQSRVTFAVGLLDLIKNGGDQGKNNCFFILQQFILANCVDKKMIIGMLDFGENYVNSYDDAEVTVGGIFNMLIPPPDLKPHDERFAIAIKAGVFEMSLKLLARFGIVQSSPMVKTMDSLFKAAGAVAMLKKSSKAISERRSVILEAVKNAERQIRGKNLEMVRAVRSIVSLNSGGKASRTAFCRRCMKHLKDDEVKSCSKCKRATYCSRAWYAWKEKDEEPGSLKSVF